MRILTIDQGNTHCKWAVWNATCPKDATCEIFDQCPKASDIPSEATQGVDHAVWLSVTDDVPAIKGIKMIRLTGETPVPIKINYEPPASLGMDRLAAAVGAWAHEPHAKALVVDAGTAITYDLLDDGTFAGGNIAPGMQMRLDALHAHTAHLPQVSLKGGKIAERGHHTEAALRSGAVWGVINEMVGYGQGWGTEDLYLTGGDAPVLKPFFQLSAIHYDPLLVARGMAVILMYNLHQDNDTSK